MKNIALAFIFTVLTSCAATSKTTTVPTIEQNKVEETAKMEAKPEIAPVKGKSGACICVKLWMPVCGENKKTYGNSCEADCAGVKYTQGTCAATK